LSIKSSLLSLRQPVADIKNQPCPWRETSKSRQIDEAWLSRQLRPYGVQPRNIRIEEVQAKGYLMEDFRETFCRYIPRSELGALRAECVPAAPPAPAKPAAA
jgi:hypothetical protein